MGNLQDFLKEFGLSPHLTGRDYTDVRIYVDMCTMGNASSLVEIERRASELGWFYYFENLTALRPGIAGKGKEKMLRIDLFLYTPEWHEWHYFRHLSKELAELGILVSILTLLLRLPRG